LLLLGITGRTVMAVMGWSSTAMAARYQHVVAAVRRDVAVQVGGLLLRPPGAGEARHLPPHEPNCNHDDERRASREGRPGVSPVQAGGSGGI
jgi:hypothetical protein